MVALNMTMLGSMSLLLGAIKPINENSLQVQYKSHMSGFLDGAPCGCHGCHRRDCCCQKFENPIGCHDPCLFDPPEVDVDPLSGIPTDDESLMVLIGLNWPRRDEFWFLEAIKKRLPQSGHFKKREVKRGTYVDANDKTWEEILHGDRKKRNADETDIFTSTDHADMAPSTIVDTTTEIIFPEGPPPPLTPITTFSPTSTTSADPTPFSEGMTTSRDSTTVSPTFIMEGTTSSPSTTPPTTIMEGRTTDTTTTTFSSTTSTTTLMEGTTSSPSTTPPTTTVREGMTTDTTTTTFSSTTSTTTFREGTTPPPPESTISSTTDIITEEEIEVILQFEEDFQIDAVVLLVGQDTLQQQVEALTVGKSALDERDQLELKIREANITFAPGAATLKHQLAFRRTDPISTTMARLGLVKDKATKKFMDDLQLPSVSTVGLPLLGDISECEDNFLDLFRPVFVVCDPCSRYRTIDGSCNNLYFRLWGAAFTPYRRDLPAVYDDGISTFRRAVDGSDLPSARLISTSVNNKPNVESQSFSILHMTYGQFIDHDLVATPLARASFTGYGGSESPVKCCDLPDPIFLFPQCAPIEIPWDDPFYQCYGQRCMEFVRSAEAGLCTFGPRQQTNQNTAYLDGSVVYGVKPEDSNDLRSFVDGLLNAQVVHENETLLPRDLNPDNQCNTADEFCFKAGDGRVNEQVLLTFLQTLWAREHNRLAGILKQQNSSWDDEKLFQEARRIVGAQLQQVTYNEYLPTLIGPTLMTTSSLYPLKGKEQTTDYDPGVNSAIANVFAAAAYRFGHSQIADYLLHINKDGVAKPQELSTLFFNPFDLYRKHGMCDLARGGFSLPDRKVDPYFTPEVAGKLFRGNQPFGLDLVSLNIQRGRDHGLPPYNEWRKFCGLPKASDFDGLLDQMTPDRVAALQGVYSNVDDIDIFVGGLSEKPIAGGMMGHTFTCLIHNQFFRIKRGDRYWFEYKNSPGAFTKAQIEQLHSVTLARIMCDNIPELEYIQRWPLKQAGPDNPKVCCKSIRQYDLDPWKDDDVLEDVEELGNDVHVVDC